MDARVGAQVGFGQSARVKFVPIAASRSRFGVRLRGFNTPSVDQCCWSDVMSSTFVIPQPIPSPPRPRSTLPRQIAPEPSAIPRRGIVPHPVPQPRLDHDPSRFVLEVFTNCRHLRRAPVISQFADIVCVIVNFRFSRRAHRHNDPIPL